MSENIKFEMYFMSVCVCIVYMSNSIQTISIKDFTIYWKFPFFCSIFLLQQSSNRISCIQWILFTPCVFFFCVHLLLFWLVWYVVRMWVNRITSLIPPCSSSLYLFLTGKLSMLIEFIVFNFKRWRDKKNCFDLFYTSLDWILKMHCNNTYHLHAHWNCGHIEIFAMDLAFWMC